MIVPSTSVDPAVNSPAPATPATDTPCTGTMSLAVMVSWSSSRVEPPPLYRPPPSIAAVLVLIVAFVRVALEHEPPSASVSES